MLYGGYACFHEWVLGPEAVARFIAEAERAWGTGATLRAGSGSSDVAIASQETGLRRPFNRSTAGRGGVENVFAKGADRRRIA